MKLACIAIFGLALGACVPTQWGPVVDKVIQEKKAFSDEEATILKQAPCMMTVGAKNRIEAKSDRDAIELLCGGKQ